MSLVIAAILPNKIVVIGDTQLSGNSNQSLGTGTKVLVVGNDTLVGITGDYDTYTKTIKHLENNHRIAKMSFSEKVSILKDWFKSFNGNNNMVIAGRENGISKVITMGKTYGYDNMIESVYENGVIKTLMPQDITEEMCMQYITSTENIEQQICTCIESVSPFSSSVNNKLFGFIFDNNIIPITKNIRYEEIDIKINI